ncbi:hypothetical protein Egran_01381, partial [Elaphomyces granulatus]
IGSRSYINAEAGQAGRGREDVSAGTARKGEGIGPRSHINAGHGQQLGPSLRGPGQAGRLGREDVPADITRKGEGIGPMSRTIHIPGHTSTLDTVNNLGALYTNQGKLDEAEKMYQRALHGYEKAWGPDHTSTLDTVNNLGILYKSQGIGPRSYINVNNWGLLYMNQGKLDEAEKMYQRALPGYETALGLENVTRYLPALNTMWNLGYLFATQGRLAEAKEMFSRAYTGFRAVLGPSSNECQRLEHNIASLDPTQAGTSDSGSTRRE